MDIQAEITKIKELLSTAQSILVITHAQPTLDSIGSASSMMIGLASLGKKVTLACPDPMTVGLSGFVGVDKIVSTLPKKNFIVSLDYVDGSIEKVSYNIEGDKFNLVIEPRPGFEFSGEKVQYTHAGAAYDVIFVLDSINLGGLKTLYEENKSLFTDKPVINLDRHAENAQFGQVNLVDTKASSMAEVVALVLSSIGARLTQDIGTNLLNAIYFATDNFTSPAVTVRAFELATACLKAGGKRFAPTGEPYITQPVKPATPVSVVAPQSIHSVPVQNTTVMSPIPVTTERPTEDAPETVAPQPFEGQTQVGEGVKPAQPEVAPTKAPADWLKPKIFKSSNLL